MNIFWLQQPESVGLSFSKENNPFQLQKVEVVAAATAVPHKLLQQSEQKILSSLQLKVLPRFKAHSAYEHSLI
jgi:hypothetical protein